MDTVRVTFSLKYSGNLSPAEKHPQVRCFLDARFDRRPVTVQLEKEDRLYHVTVEGKILKNQKIPSTAALCFASMAWRLNDLGVPCLLDTGVAHVTLGEISQVDKHFYKQLDLKMNTAEGLRKGTLNIQIDRLEGIHLQAPLVGAETTVPLINAYINETMEMEQNMQETFQGTSNMRIPFDYSESGIQTTLNTPLPAVAYVMAEIPRCNDAYWDNAFKTIMDRDSLKVEEWHRLNLAGKARATILTVAYAAQYMDYVSDTVDRNTRYRKYSRSLVQGYENFGDALAMDSGDCEDLASVIFQCHSAFLKHKFPDNWVIHKEMQSIGENYIPPLSLDVVRGAQVADNVKNYGAHMNDNFIPIDKFKSWLEATREGREVAKTLPIRCTIPGLPFLVGEGTGMYEPYGYENSLVPLMAYVFSAMSLQMFKKQILHKPGDPGSFFVGSLVGMTDYFYKRGTNSPMSFWYCTKQKDGTLTRGASYEDMMNDSPNVAIKVQPALSRTIMTSIEEAVLRRIPPNDLILTKEHKNHHSVLERVSKAVQDFKRKPGLLHQKVSFFARPHHLSHTIGSQIIADFTKMNRVWRVQYKLESITDKIWGFRVDVYVH